jgi:hypothetical protein
MGDRQAAAGVAAGRINAKARVIGRCGRRRSRRDALRVGNVVVVAVIVIVVYAIVVLLRRHGHGIIARRGLSIGADLGALSDAPRVRIRSLARVGPDRVRLVLAPEDAQVVRDGAGAPDLDLVVWLHEEDFGFGLLQEWQQGDRLLAIVLPPGGRLVRLRSVDDLQHLTLRRVGDN